MAYIDHLISKHESKNKNVRVMEFSNYHSPTPLSLEKCLQSTKVKHFHNFSSKKLQHEKNVHEKHSCCNEYQEKCIPLEKDSLRNIVSTIPVILTSPDGKVKQLLKKNKSRVTALGNGIQIQSNLEFWLPNIGSALPGNYQKWTEDALQPKYRDEKTDDRDLREFQEALRFTGLNLGSSNFLLRVFQTIDGYWIAISTENVLRLKQKTEDVHCISIKDISCIFVENNYLAICIVMDPEKSDLEFMDIVPGLPAKTESLITSLLFASTRLTLNSHTNDDLGFTTVPLLNLPSCKLMSQYFGEDGKPIIYSGLATVVSVELETNLNDELMMQMGSDMYYPVDVQIRGSTLKIVPIPNMMIKNIKNHEEIVLDISGICSLKKSDNPRPHTLTISWESKSMNLSASNSATADALFGRLRTFKECHSMIVQQPAFIIVSEYFLFLFAVSKSKELLLQSPTLNLINLGNPDPFSILLSSSTKEADEFIDNDVKNTCWWKFSFFSEHECQNFSKVFSSSVDSLMEDC